MFASFCSINEAHGTIWLFEYSIDRNVVSMDEIHIWATIGSLIVPMMGRDRTAWSPVTSLLLW